MAENDVAKMKVADLKRELKLRGLAITGNKNELQERLSTALLDGELSLEDTAISGEDLLDGDDTVLTDEDEAKILGADENELLKSPTSNSTALPDVGSKKDVLRDSKDELLTTKKFVLKRKSSFIGISSVKTNSTSTTDIVINTSNTAKENNEPQICKEHKMSGRNPISLASMGERQNALTKVSHLSLQERLEMRAKKFGTNTTAPIAISNDCSKQKISTETFVADGFQIEMLKKRAERFGCVVSSKIAKIDAEEKLLKRKQRFGLIDKDSRDNNSPSINVWAEKARLRLERFKSGTTKVATVPHTVIQENST